MRPRVLAPILMIVSAGIALFSAPRYARPLPLFSRSQSRLEPHSLQKPRRAKLEERYHLRLR